MFTKVKEKIRGSANKIKKAVIRLKVSSLSSGEALCNQRGSQTVEYVLIAAAAVVVILIVVLPAMKSLFNSDIFPGLQDKVKDIFKFS